MYFIFFINFLNSCTHSTSLVPSTCHKEVHSIIFFSIDKVCWDDISLPADSKGCRYFSTAKLLKVLIGCIKHAINDVIPDDEENSDKDKSVTCKQKNNMAVLDVKVYVL